MNKEELIELVIKIQNSEGTEMELDQMIETFSKNVPDPRAIDYIFEKEFEDLSAVEIVEKSLSYKGFTL